MALPSVSLPKKTVKVGKETVEVRALSRSEAVRLAEFTKNPDEGETFIVACGCGVSMDEAREWRQTTPADVVGAVVDGILTVSGLMADKDGDGPF